MISALSESNTFGFFSFPVKNRDRHFREDQKTCFSNVLPEDGAQHSAQNVEKTTVIGSDSPRSIGSFIFWRLGGTRLSEKKFGGLTQNIEKSR